MADRSLEVSDALSALVVQQPFYAVLLFDLLTVEETESIPTAATDGARILINPAFFKQITVQERIGVLAHEITHVILAHPTRTRGYIELGVGPDVKPFNPMKMNYAQDYIINQMLHEAGFKLPLGSLFNPQITSNDIADEVYLKLPDPPEDPNDGQQGGEGNWDNHIPASDPASLPDQSTIQRSLKMAESAAKQIGNLPASLQRLVDEVCEPQVKWTDYVLKTLVTMSGHDEQSYCRPNRRRLAVPPHIYWPGRIGSRSGTGAIEIDTSGSIGDEVIKTFFGELHGIMQDCTPEKLYIGFVDAALHNGELHEIEDINDLLDLKSKCGGGGGTDMTVIFKELEERQLHADYVIILTDGYTPFGEDTGIPTIWCITEESITAPWGTTVHVKIGG